jgi:pimeloyl-ACP methyl ester carboxylesterase
MEEERRVVHYDGMLGVSLYYRSNVRRTTVILIHGADAETREMGWIVPYFVCNGVNVISYDQRGTGVSSGNWRANGPPDRARDVDAIYDAFHNDAHVDPQRTGVWGFSNGGWTAPIVAVNRAIAFMILKSAPTGPIEQNSLFEQRQLMLRAGRNEAEIAQATVAAQAVLDAILRNAPISGARSAYAQARDSEWYKDSFFAMIPENEMLTEPYLSGWRRYLSYDPAPILAKVRTPTLALYGARDRKVDVYHDAPVLNAAYEKSGTPLTVKWFPDAGHSLKVTPNGFDLANPQRYSRGFPDVMLQWLRERNFITIKS